MSSLWCQRRRAPIQLGRFKPSARHQPATAQNTILLLSYFTISYIPFKDKVICDLKKMTLRYYKLNYHRRGSWVGKITPNLVRPHWKCISSINYKEATPNCPPIMVQGLALQYINDLSSLQKHILWNEIMRLKIYEDRKRERIYKKTKISLAV